MKKNNIIFTLMSIVGILCTAVCLCYLFRNRLKETALFQKFFGDSEEEPDDFFEEFEEEEESTPEEEVLKEEEPAEEAAEEEEQQAPKVRRGYIPLRFQTEQSA